MKINDLPMVLTIKDLQKALQIGRPAAYNLARSGQLETIRIGKCIRITRKALMAYLGY